MDITLHSTGLDDLSPAWYRSPGIHGSQLIDRLCLRLGHYEKDKSGAPISDRNREMGQAFEDMIAQRAEKANPGEYFHNPEIECDGVYLTPDLVHAEGGWDHEIKWTWMSPANSPEDMKMWKYRVQGMAYLYGLRRVAQGTAKIREKVIDPAQIVWTGPDEATRAKWARVAATRWLTLYLTVGFANDFRPREEQIPTWRIVFWPEELAANWAMLMQERAKMLAEMEAEFAALMTETDTHTYDRGRENDLYGS